MGRKSLKVAYSLINRPDEQFLTVIVPGHNPLLLGSDHPNFDRVMKTLVQAEGQQVDPDFDHLVALVNDVQGVLRVDVKQAVEQLAAPLQEAALRFDPNLDLQRLSERVILRDGKVEFDGDAVDSKITTMILSFIKDGHDPIPLVKFFEKIMVNPIYSLDAEEQYARVGPDEIFQWVQAQDTLTITEDGNLIAYKGVRQVTDSPPVFKSTYGGGIGAMVDGRILKGDRLAYEIGSTVEMSRSQAHHNPGRDCAAGLHIGTWSYAKGYGNTRIAVEVNPRDIVSVPEGRGNHQKVRCCRFKVLGVVTEPYKQVLRTEQPVEDAPPAPRVESIQQAARTYEVGLTTGASSTQRAVELLKAEQDLKDAKPSDKAKATQEQIAQARANYHEEMGDSTPSEARKQPSKATSKAPEGRTPSEKEFERMTALAKAQKKGIAKVAPSRGWKLILKGLPKERESWRIEPRTPSQDEFVEMSFTAKKRRKGFQKVAESKGWKLVGSDPKNHEDWLIV